MRMDPGEGGGDGVDFGADEALRKRKREQLARKEYSGKVAKTNVN